MTVPSMLMLSGHLLKFSLETFLQDSQLAGMRMQPHTQCVSLHAGECLRDLLDMSAKLLRPGGRLVYFLPAAPEVYKEEEIPQHPALKLTANSEQVLSTKFSRRLITMEKVSHCEVHQREWYRGFL